MSKLITLIDPVTEEAVYPITSTESIISPTGSTIESILGAQNDTISGFDERLSAVEIQANKEDGIFALDCLDNRSEITETEYESLRSIIINKKIVIVHTSKVNELGYTEWNDSYVANNTYINTRNELVISCLMDTGDNLGKLMEIKISSTKNNDGNYPMTYDYIENIDDIIIFNVDNGINDNIFAKLNTESEKVVAVKTSTPAKTSLSTNAIIPANIWEDESYKYIHYTWLNYLVEYKVSSTALEKTIVEIAQKSDIPTKVSELENDSNFATTSEVETKIAELIDSAPDTLNTLGELAEAINNNSDIIEALDNSITSKADKATTLSGYGIADANINDSNGSITLGTKTYYPSIHKPVYTGDKSLKITNTYLELNDDIESNRESIYVPYATTSSPGVVSIGDNLNIDNSGKLSAIIPTKISELENDVPYVADDVLKNGVYIMDLEGKIHETSSWNNGSNSTGIVLVTDKVSIVISPSEWYTYESNSDGAWNGNTKSAWGGYGTIVPKCNLSTDLTTALLDLSGNTNTEAIISKLSGTSDSNSSYYIGAPAAEYCSNYSNGAKTLGAWYLPSVGELNEIVINKDAINSALDLISGEALNANMHTWTSTQYSENSSWYYNWDSGEFDDHGKYYDSGVRPICSLALFTIKERLNNLENELQTKITRMDLATDLSKFDIYGNAIQQTTANCYVINRTGYYKFPCVYGNAIKNNKVNAPAYTKTSGDYNMDFVNYKDTAITSPYIELDTEELIVKAELIIADTDEVITDVIVDNDSTCKYVAFNVTTVPTTGANGLISVLNNEGTIMWTWHIWIWPDDLTPETITNYTGIDYQILPVNLGSKWDDENKTHIKNWFYQWGRITPTICPATYNSNTDATNYGTRTFTKVNKANSYGIGIQNPDKFYYNASEPYNWFGTMSYYNLWDASCNTTGTSDNNTVKTVYDPCPIGYKIPNGNTFTGFTTTGTNSSTASEFNVVGSFASGWYFKRNADDTTGLFFPACGYRYHDSGGLDYVSWSGYCWSSASSSQGTAYSLYFHSGHVYPWDYNYRAGGFGVRPALE